MSQAAKKYAVQRVCAMVLELVNKRTEPARKKEEQRYLKHRAKVIDMQKRHATAVAALEERFVKDDQFEYHSYSRVSSTHRSENYVAIKDDVEYLDGCHARVHHATIARPYIDRIMLAQDKDLADVLDSLVQLIKKA